jgi:phage baseplate assembly protein W
MAYGAKKIFPIDTKPRIAIGVSIPFNQPGVFGSTYVTKDSIKTNLINYFLTNTNERYLNPSLGGNLRVFIFEQITSGNIDFLKEDIQTQIQNFFPSVIVDSLNVLQNPDDNSITIELYYSIANTGITDNLQIEFQ